MDWTVYRELGIAAGLGLLVGLQCEWTQRDVAGIRTFALITIFGTETGLVGAFLTSCSRDSWLRRSATGV